MLKHVIVASCLLLSISTCVAEGIVDHSGDLNAVYVAATAEGKQFAVLVNGADCDNSCAVLNKWIEHNSALLSQYWRISSIISEHKMMVAENGDEVLAEDFVAEKSPPKGEPVLLAYSASGKLERAVGSDAIIQILGDGL